MQEIIVGRKYRHYKGNIYKIIALAKHSETLEDMVVYENVEKGDIWVRPKSMWNDEIELNGVDSRSEQQAKVYRFTGLL